MNDDVLGLRVVRIQRMEQVLMQIQSVASKRLIVLRQSALFVMVLFVAMAWQGTTTATAQSSAASAPTTDASDDLFRTTTESDRPSRRRGLEKPEVYLTPTQAMRQLFPAPLRIENARLKLSAEERKLLGKKIGRRLFEREFVVYRALDGENRCRGYAIITEEIGKFQPITFVVGVTPQSTIRAVSVMVYRESHGADVKRRRFLAQFDGKGLRAPLRLNRDIINISGATLSVRAVARGSRKVLHVIDMLLVKGSRQLDWCPCKEFAEPGAVNSGVSPREQHASVSEGDVSAMALASQTQREVRYLMGTLLELRVDAKPAQARRAMRAAFDEVAKLEQLWSLYRAESELSQFAQQPAGVAMQVSQETYDCVSTALHWATLTDGAFDPTLQADGYRQLVLDPEARSITRLNDTLRIDVGGIGKGIALDRAAARLRAEGCERALLNFGGQILALEAPRGARGWWVAVKDPSQPEQALALTCVTHLSVSSSGDYERGAHIVDPYAVEHATGVTAVVGADIAGATVVARSATAADVLSTYFRLRGVAGAKALRAAPASYRCWVVQEQGATWQGGDLNPDYFRWHVPSSPLAQAR